MLIDAIKKILESNGVRFSPEWYDEDDDWDDNVKAVKFYDSSHFKTFSAFTYHKENEVKHIDLDTPKDDRNENGDIIYY